MVTEEKTRKDPNEVTFNVFVGSETGFLKGICFGEETPLLKELSEYDQGRKPVAIRSLSWADRDERKELLVGMVDHSVKVFNSKLRAYTKEFKIGLEDSPLVSLQQYNSNYLVGLENGKVSLWDSDEGKSVQEFQSGDQLSCMRLCPSDSSVFATGGKENDVKIWSITSGGAAVNIFKARNVPHVLELRQPVWVQDLTFLPQTTDLVAAATRYGHIRLYDVKADNRNRPVVNMPFCDHPLMSISPTRNDRQVLVGSSQGKVGLVDIRNYGKEKIVHLFNGFVGSVRNIVADENTPYFVSCGLDRHVYFHHLDQRNPIKKLYLKSRLTQVAITKNLLGDLPTPDDVQSSWHNIDMAVLPGPTSRSHSSQEEGSASSPKKRKKQSMQ